jgi:F0F1-type ATP synthase membrane subunit c/vacuolar-type H+-ATPase subunit K
VNPLVDNPALLFVIALGMLCLSAWLGAFVGRTSREPDERSEHDIGVVLAATLTLLGLIIGFSFSMAISRYDQRKNYEEAEANSIATEFVRADLLPADDAGRVRLLLKQYLDQRVLFYSTRNSDRSSLAMTSTAGAAGSERRGELRPIGPLAAFHLPELRHHLAACLGDVCRDGLALRLKAKPGSPLAIGRDPEIADKTGAGRGHGRSLGPHSATAAQRHKFRMLISRAGRSGSFRYSR